MCDYIITGIHFFFSSVVQIFTFTCGSLLLGGSLYSSSRWYFVKKREEFMFERFWSNVCFWKTGVSEDLISFSNNSSCVKAQFSEMTDSGVKCFFNIKSCQQTFNFFACGSNVWLCLCFRKTRWRSGPSRTARKNTSETASWSDARPSSMCYAIVILRRVWMKQLSFVSP